MTYLNQQNVILYNQFKAKLYVTNKQTEHLWKETLKTTIKDNSLTCKQTDFKHQNHHKKNL